jgi:hypothetical protein
MREIDLDILRASVDHVVRIVCCDGEIMLAKILFVFDDDEEVIYDLVSTTKESQHEKHDKQPAYLIRFKDIEHVEPQQTS